jgi:hypothetical protein
VNGADTNVQTILAQSWKGLGVLIDLHNLTISQ